MSIHRIASPWNSKSRIATGPSGINLGDLVAGVGAYALEIFDELADPDVILVPVGPESGICGTELVAKKRRPRTRVIGVQLELAPAVTLSWRAG